MLFSEENIRKVFTNPFYCLGDGVVEIFTARHKPLVTEEEFIKVATLLVKEIGLTKYLTNLLENLKGNYI